jgi:plastocyanin
VGALRLTALAVVVAAFGIAPAALLAEEPAPGPAAAPSAGQPAAAATGVSTGVGTTSIATPSAARPVARSSRAATASAASASVRIGDYFFKPKDVTISAGDSVTWKNTGKVPEGHTVTGDGFDSGVLKSGDTYTHTFSTAGSFDYVCTIHPNMHGTVTVTASASGAGNGGGGGGSSSSSGAGSSSGGGSSGVGFDNSDSGGASAPDSSGGGGSLPSTGLNLPLLAEIGLGLIAAGLLVRRVGYR